MTETRQPLTDLHALFGYRDATAAITWLQRAFGFETTMSFPDEKGGIAHSELRLGDAVVVVYSDHDGYERPPRKGPTMGYGVYLSVPAPADVDALYARAPTIWKPETTEWATTGSESSTPRVSSDRSECTGRVSPRTSGRTTSCR